MIYAKDQPDWQGNGFAAGIPNGTCITSVPALLDKLKPLPCFLKKPFSRHNPHVYPISR
jgi:hypothetical protein